MTGRFDGCDMIVFWLGMIVVILAAVLVIAKQPAAAPRGGRRLL
jgi:hypothetical protein